MQENNRATGSDSAGNTSHTATDYERVDLPANEPRSEWHYTYRRAEMLELIREAGHPDDLNQSELAERYDVDQSTISRDLDRVGQGLRENLDMDRHFLTIDSVLNRCIRGLIDEGEYRKAAQTAMEYDGWIQDRVEAERFTERIERLEDLADSDSGQLNQ